MQKYIGKKLYEKKLYEYFSEKNLNRKYIFYNVPLENLFENFYESISSSNIQLFFQ